MSASLLMARLHCPLSGSSSELLDGIFSFLALNKARVGRPIIVLKANGMLITTNCAINVLVMGFSATVKGSWMYPMSAMPWQKKPFITWVQATILIETINVAFASSILATGGLAGTTSVGLDIQQVLGLYNTLRLPIVNLISCLGLYDSLP
uniref:Uncharacterized protein n=1 Tax=Cannabis sativa TaxID=3483 RepID=A0A803PK60_CANSA